MNFAADVKHLTARPGQSDPIHFAGFAASDERDAVRKAADAAAKRRYGDEAQSGWIEADRTRPGHYLVMIGVGKFLEGGYQLKGVQAAIHVWTVE